MPELTIRLLETPEDIAAVERLQSLVWPGSDIEIVPAHVLLTATHNGGLVIGAFLDDELVGFVFGFPGLEFVPDGPRPKHCSHMMGVHPGHRSLGVGYALKRAQWQMVRHQGLDHVTWTYDPLLSRNAHLNISRLGAVCNFYRRSEYGELRDGLNAGLPTDRFQVDWWINSQRVARRMGERAHHSFGLDHFIQAGVQGLYPVQTGPGGLPRPPEHFSPPGGRLVLAEIPSDFHDIKAKDFPLARDWRFFCREVFENLFAAGYLVTDFVYDRSGNAPRSLYVLTHGEATLEE